MREAIPENFNSIPLFALILWSFEVFTAHGLFPLLGIFPFSGDNYFRWPCFKVYGMLLPYFVPRGVPKTVKNKCISNRTFLMSLWKSGKSEDLKIWVEGGNFEDFWNFEQLFFLNNQCYKVSHFSNNDSRLWNVYKTNTESMHHKAFFLTFYGGYKWKELRSDKNCGQKFKHQISCRNLLETIQNYIYSESSPWGESTINKLHWEKLTRISEESCNCLLLRGCWSTTMLWMFFCYSTTWYRCVSRRCFIKIHNWRRLTISWWNCNSASFRALDGISSHAVVHARFTNPIR